MFLGVSYIFLGVSYMFLGVSYIFLGFSYIFLGFSYIFLRFSYMFGNSALRKDACSIKCQDDSYGSPGLLQAEQAPRKIYDNRKLRMP